MANQGGPIWWASQHRSHHKFCDQPRDPHSALQVGTERAFSFFLEHGAVNEEFAPRHNDTFSLRVLDTWANMVVCFEHAMAFAFFGREGLFVAYTSSWICQTITLWFNVANHPERKARTCKASDFKARPSGTYYLPYWFLDQLYFPLGIFVGETKHEHHHDHSNLALRDDLDLAYYWFILPLEKLGLVWDVKMPLEKKCT
jgi:fatty-acid desaturase